MRTILPVSTLVVALALGLGCNGRGSEDAGAKDKPKQVEAPRPDFSKQPTPDELEQLVARGEEAFLDFGCDSCHSATGRTGSRGPGFVGLFGTRARFADGSEATRDEAYLYEAIVDPGAKLVEGWTDSQMPITPIETDDAVAVVYFVRSLADKADE